MVDLKWEFKKLVFFLAGFSMNSIQVLFLESFNFDSKIKSEKKVA